MQKKTIALGIDDFKTVIEGNNYFVDKSLLIKDAITDGAGVTLLPRPRRWGKTLNLSMLYYFFVKNEVSYRHLFNGLEVEQHPEVMAHQGKYPVIFLSLKEAKKTSWSECYQVLQDLIIQEYKKHIYLLESEFLDQYARKDFEEIIAKRARQTTYESSLYTLSALLHRYHGKEPIILLDEYDSPIHAGFVHGFYPEIINFIRTFMGMAFKGNIHLKKGFVTGILRVSKESIFSGLNNLYVCTILDRHYSQYFGFTEVEVSAMLEYFGHHENDEKMNFWYNNYHMGNQETVYNPWSVLSYLKKDRTLAPHWMNMSDNLLIKEVIQKAPTDFKHDLELLMQGKTIEKRIVDLVTFDQMFKDADVAYSFLLFTGYLSFEKQYLKDIDMMTTLKIPNNEVLSYYKNTIIEWTKTIVTGIEYQTMLKDLTSGDIKEFKEFFESTVERVLSSFDVSHDEPEKFYHLFVLGMLVYLQESHQVLSNRESGNGRYDVMIIPKDQTKLGVIIEFKRAKGPTDELLALAAQNALEQIEKKQYKAELEARGIVKVINVAIAFSGKKVLVH